MSARMQPLSGVIAEHAAHLSDEERENLTRVLVAREDEMADHFRMAGMQFGLYPWIVAEVFAEVGIGTPLQQTERDVVRRQFEQGMEELRRQMGQ